mmetsp:Transcript_43944/g.103978  ORF Transcript_43944/g.103978 Transcript_43944/m.103978 type:complete len:86 (+) Transcript_43944:1920-2177(+)
MGKHLTEKLSSLRRLLAERELKNQRREHRQEEVGGQKVPSSGLAWLAVSQPELLSPDSATSGFSQVRGPKRPNWQPGTLQVGDNE